MQTEENEIAYVSRLARFSPTCWPAWAGLGVLRLVSRLPYSRQLAVGRGLGRLMYRMMPHRRHIVRRNLELCFPDWDEARRECTVRAHFESMGVSVIEMGMCWWAPDHLLEDKVRIEGLEHFRAAMSRGKGVILFSAHFTPLDICGRLLTRYIDIQIMYKPSRHPVLGEIMRRKREAIFEEAIPKDATRRMIRSLRRGRAVWYAPDQNHRGRNSALVPFFSVPANTNIGTARLARMTGAAVVPFFMQRLPGDHGYLLTMQPALEDFPGECPVTATERTNRLIEEQVRRAPEQYWWMHRRFRKRPTPLPDAYT